MASDMDLLAKFSELSQAFGYLTSLKPEPLTSPFTDPMAVAREVKAYVHRPADPLLDPYKNVRPGWDIASHGTTSHPSYELLDETGGVRSSGPDLVYLRRLSWLLAESDDLSRRMRAL